jgi:hypothetical protein
VGERRGCRGIGKFRRIFRQLSLVTLQSAGSLERRLQPVLTHRFQQVIDRAGLEGFDRVLIVSGKLLRISTT